VSEYREYDWGDGPTDAHKNIYKDLLSILHHDRDKVILDVGCGNGEIANNLIREGYDVYGVDASKSGIEIAKKKNAKRFFIQDIVVRELPIDLIHKNINLIISTEVIEHLYDPRGYVNYCKEILSKSGGGDLILSTPYHGYIKNLALALTGKMDDHFTVLWDGGHIKFWSVKTLSKLLNECGFEVIEFRGSGRVPYLWKSMFVRAKIG